MVLSMTGYGEASRELHNKRFKIEIKSLNGKMSDIRFKSNTSLKDKEIELRRMIHENAVRGKFDVNLNIESTEAENDDSLNIKLMESYSSRLKEFADSQGLEYGDMLQSIIRLPNIIQLNDEGLNTEEWSVVKSMTNEALEGLMTFRKNEGVSLENDVLNRVSNIMSLLKSIEPHESSRIINLKERINRNLELYLGKDKVDENRYEQEVMYYLEKLDINEEKVRLEQHCKHFTEAVQKEKIEKGKKLSFISQEIGREINTLGAKAQHSEIQQIVVNMKDQLEKIKEQVLNIL
ncbi:MAG: YicC family protein [Saprospiraceae bacterium]|nr:YicC family protein [Bacteroidia bacterium]MBT8230336.1 YicC family protein [Bacteroidia bacterium]NNF21704.1 YicC family protein [Saprospiraceae bacterium]